MTTDQDEAINSLIRITARGFYSIGYVLVLEALIWHKVLSEDDLRSLMNFQPKDFRAIVAKLLEDRLITEFKQREPMKPGETDRYKTWEDRERDKIAESKGDFNMKRHITRSYFYIQYSIAIDAIKWKVDSIVRQVDNELNKTNEKGFICPRCRKRYSELDIQSLFNDDFTEVYCNICNAPLVEDDFSEKSKLRQERSIRLKSQIDPILQWLKKIDDATIEDNNIESCFMQRTPTNDNSFAMYAKLNKGSTMFDQHSMLSASTLRDKNSNGTPKASYDSTTIKVNIAMEGEDEAKLQQEKMKLKLNKAEQNALPSWYQESTVGKQALGKLDGDEEDSSLSNTGATVGSSSGAPTSSSAISANVNASADDKTATLSQASSVEPKEGNDELSAYYERLRAKKEEEDDDDDDVDDEEFADFEDV